MANVFMMDLRLEGSAWSYVRAENEEQAVKFFLDFLMTDEGKEYIKRKIERAEAAGLWRPIVGTRAFSMTESWPSDMYDLDATASQTEEIAS